MQELGSKPRPDDQSCVNLGGRWAAHWPARYEVELWQDGGAVVYDEGTGEITALSLAHSVLLQMLLDKPDQSVTEVAEAILEQAPTGSDMVHVSDALHFLQSMALVQVR